MICIALYSREGSVVVSEALDDDEDLFLMKDYKKKVRMCECVYCIYGVCVS